MSTDGRKSSKRHHHRHHAEADAIESTEHKKHKDHKKHKTPKQETSEAKPSKKRSHHAESESVHSKRTHDSHTKKRDDSKDRDSKRVRTKETVPPVEQDSEDDEDLAVKIDAAIERVDAISNNTDDLMAALFRTSEKMDDVKKQEVEYIQPLNREITKCRQDLLEYMNARDIPAIYVSKDEDGAEEMDSGTAMVLKLVRKQVVAKALTPELAANIRDRLCSVPEVIDVYKRVLEARDARLQAWRHAQIAKHFPARFKVAKAAFLASLPKAQAPGAKKTQAKTASSGPKKTAARLKLERAMATLEPTTAPKEPTQVPAETPPVETKEQAKRRLDEQLQGVEQQVREALEREFSEKFPPLPTETEDDDANKDGDDAADDNGDEEPARIVRKPRPSAAVYNGEYGDLSKPLTLPAAFALIYLQAVIDVHLPVRPSIKITVVPKAMLKRNPDIVRVGNPVDLDKRMLQKAKQWVTLKDVVKQRRAVLYGTKAPCQAALDACKERLLPLLRHEKDNRIIAEFEAGQDKVRVAYAEEIVTEKQTAKFTLQDLTRVVKGTTMAILKPKDQNKPFNPKDDIPKIASGPVQDVVFRAVLEGIREHMDAHSTTVTRCKFRRSKVLPADYDRKSDVAGYLDSDEDNPDMAFGNEDDDADDE